MARATSPALGRDTSPPGPKVSFFRHPILYINSRLDLKFITLVVVLMATGSAVAIGIASRQISTAVQDNLIQRATNVGATLAGTAALLLEGVPRDRYSEALDGLVPVIRAAMNADPYIDYVAGVDRQGVALVHSDPSRRGRSFDDPVGREAAAAQDVLVQLYPRDTGQLMYDVAVPVVVAGQARLVMRIGVDTSEIAAAARSATIPISVLAVAGVLAGSVLTVIATHRLVDPLRRLVGAAQQLAAGNLTVRVDTRLTDEVGMLSRAFNDMVTTLNRLVASTVSASRQMAQHSEHLAGASGQASQAVQDIARQMEDTHDSFLRQDEQIQQTTAAMEQLTAAVDQIAVGSQEQANEMGEMANLVEAMAGAIGAIAQEASGVLEFSESAALSARSGGETLRKAIEGLQTIQVVVNDAASRVAALDERSDQITRMVDMISDIAEQTSLLSLNAAIEAARAGDEGRGFAVVAQEVRRLADRSSEAAREIRDTVAQIRSEIAASVAFMNQSAAMVNEQAASAGDVDASLQALVRQADESRNRIGRITDAAQRADEQGREVVRAMQNINAIVEENAAATEEIAASSNEVLRAMAEVAEGTRRQRQLVEEGSAATAELAASMAEVARSSDDLADMGRELKTLTAQFRVE